jgi:NAD(P)-dependent dehydrogenase (short-subunit alcohol dehydrogenase family)
MTELDLTGAVVVVTGATRGIGRRAARLFAEAGASVVVTGRSSDERPNASLPGSVQQVVAELGGSGAAVHGIVADLGKPEGARAVIDGTLERFGRCDVLLSNAAYMWSGGFVDSPLRRYELAFRVNVLAFIELAQAFLPGMLERGEGRVITVSSGAALPLGAGGFSVYGSTKAALERISGSVHVEYADRGIASNVLRIEEGVPTEMYQLSTTAGGVSVAAAEEMYSPEQVAEALVWMARRPAEWSGHCVDFAALRVAGVLPSRRPSRPLTT